MLKNYFKIAHRNLIKNKLFTFINLFGLGLGIASCLLITLYINHELQYDKFHANSNRIVRAIMEYSFGGAQNKGSYTSTKVGPSFKRNFPEIEEFVRMAPNQRIVKYGERVCVENNFLYTDSTILKVFSFKLLKGSTRDALSGINKIVISESMAKKYFGDENPIGKILKISSQAIDYEVKGVIEDCPKNSHIKYDFLSSLSSTGGIQEETYWNANFVTYFLLKPNTNIEVLQKKIRAFMKTELKNDLTGNDYATYELEPLTKIHLYSPYSNFGPNGSITYVYMIGGVAVLILIIACFTFINLSTARSSERAREIGIRKVAGAIRVQIFKQFISESFLVVTLSACFGFFLAFLLVPYFSELMAREIVSHALLRPDFIFVGLLLIVFISVSAGAYPAFILSALQPIKVLKGVFKNTGSGLALRKSLFVFQFVISVFLIICSFIIQKQLHYIQNKDLGFDREHVIQLPFDGKVFSNYNAFKNALKEIPSVKYVAKGDFEPCNILGGYNMSTPEALSKGKGFSVTAGTIDEEYLQACGIKLFKGSYLTEKDVEDASHENYEKNFYHFVINKAAAIQLGWKPEEAVGKKMFLDESRPGVVKAVMEDFHFKSLHEPIKPLVLFPGSYSSKVLVKVSGENLSNTIHDLNSTWDKLFSHRPFEYTFLDEFYNSLYVSELRLGRAIMAFTLIAILLACIGLFGLSSYSIDQRVKEIGIRKVLGASVSDIILKLSGNFILLVCLAVVISIPFAWWVMHEWLANFSYRTDIGLWIFLLCGIGAVALSFITISFKVVRTANANLSQNLRTE